MMHPRLLYVAFAGILLMGLLHLLAGYFEWYWTMPGFDKVVHCVAGLSLGFFSLWVWYASGLFGVATPSKRQAFVTAVIIVMLIGITWEFFEYVYGIANPALGQTYGQDTFTDLMADLLGAMIAGVAGRFRGFYE